MRRMTLVLLILVMVLSSVGCADWVRPGNVGMRAHKTGFDGQVLRPGRHECWGWCDMYHMESRDQSFDIPMSVLCADSLNFKFQVSVLVGLNTDKDNHTLLTEAFKRLRPTNDNHITVKQIFLTYLKPVADQEARKVVSRYQTSEIVSKRAQIIEEVVAAIMAASSGTVLRVKRVTVNNLDFPDVVTRAQEVKAQSRVQIDTVRAESAKRIEQAKASLQLAEIQYKKELIEAAMVADANRIIASSITPGYLAFKQLEVIREAAQGPNNWGFVPYSDQVTPALRGGKMGGAIIDSALRKRMEDAQRASRVKPAEVEKPAE